MTAKYSKFSHIYNIAPLALLISCAILTSCVSSTLQTKPQTNTIKPATQSTEMALSEEQRQSHDARLRAIEDIHAKAVAMPKNDEAPAYGVPREGEVAALTPAQIQQKTQALETTSANAQQKIPESEVAAKQRAIAELRRKGNTHYQNAKTKIKNSY